MKPTTVQTVFFYALLLGALAVVGAMFLPFGNVLALSAVLALTFRPIFLFLRHRICRGHGTIASLLTLLVILVVILGPLSWIGARVFSESRGLYDALSQSGEGFTETVSGWIEGPIRAYAPDFRLDVRAYTSTVLQYLAEHVGTLVGGALSVVASVLLILVATFFFLKDGPQLVGKIRRLSPLDDADDEALADKVALAVNAVVRGVVLVGVIQGILVGVGFAVFGVGNATLWGFLSAILAMVPGLGTGLVTLPAVLFLIAGGKTGAAIGLAVWGFVVVGLVDNFLAPYFYSKGIQIHQVAILFAVLGGIALWGPFGFIYGPIVLALFVALVSVYRDRFARGDA